MPDRLTAIPVVDLSHLHIPDLRENVVQTIGRAFEEIGFVYIKTPGVSAMLPPTYSAFSEVFHLPEVVKRKYERAEVGWQRGWAPIGTEEAIFCRIKNIRENLPRKGNQYEWWFIGPEIDPDHHLAKKFFEIYPQNVWPNEVPEFQRVMTALYNKLCGYGPEILSAAGEYIGRPQGHYEEMAKDSPTVMRALYYPAGSKPPLACQHTDINLVTILPPATRSWLFVKPRWARTDDDVWIHAQSSQPDLSLAQVGIQLEHDSAGRYLAADHKVEAPSYPTPEDRFSAALFLHTRSDVTIRPKGPNPVYWVTTAAALLRKTLVDIKILPRY